MKPANVPKPRPAVPANPTFTTSLGKTVTMRGGMVRKPGPTMATPKPINLPSRKAENNGFDPTVQLVPGGSWAGSGSRPTVSVSNPMQPALPKSEQFSEQAPPPVQSRVPWAAGGGPVRNGTTDFRPWPPQGAAPPVDAGASKYVADGNQKIFWKEDETGPRGPADDYGHRQMVPPNRSSQAPPLSLGRGHSWDDDEEEMNFNEPIVLPNNSGSGAGSSPLAAVRPGDHGDAEGVSTPLTAQAFLSVAPSLPIVAAPLNSGPVDPAVEEARLLARKKQLELERMHEQMLREEEFRRLREEEAAVRASEQAKIRAAEEKFALEERQRKLELEEKRREEERRREDERRLEEERRREEEARKREEERLTFLNQPLLMRKSIENARLRRQQEEERLEAERKEATTQKLRELDIRRAQREQEEREARERESRERERDAADKREREILEAERQRLNKSEKQDMEGRDVQNRDNFQSGGHRAGFESVPGGNRRENIERGPKKLFDHKHNRFVTEDEEPGFLRREMALREEARAEVDRSRGGAHARGRADRGDFRPSACHEGQVPGAFQRPRNADEGRAAKDLKKDPLERAALKAEALVERRKKEQEAQILADRLRSTQEAGVGSNDGAPPVSDSHPRPKSGVVRGKAGAQTNQTNGPFLKRREEDPSSSNSLKSGSGVRGVSTGVSESDSLTAANTESVKELDLTFGGELVISNAVISSGGAGAPFPESWQGATNTFSAAPKSLAWGATTDNITAVVGQTASLSQIMLEEKMNASAPTPVTTPSAGTVVVSKNSGSRPSKVPANKSTNSRVTSDTAAGLTRTVVSSDQKTEPLICNSNISEEIVDSLDSRQGFGGGSIPAPYQHAARWERVLGSGAQGQLSASLPLWAPESCDGSVLTGFALPLMVPVAGYLSTGGVTAVGGSAQTSAGPPQQSGLWTANAFSPAVPTAGAPVWTAAIQAPFNTGTSPNVGLQVPASSVFVGTHAAGVAGSSATQVPEAAEISAHQTAPAQSRSQQSRPSNKDASRGGFQEAGARKPGAQRKEGETAAEVKADASARRPADSTAADGGGAGNSAFSGGKGGATASGPSKNARGGHRSGPPRTSGGASSNSGGHTGNSGPPSAGRGGGGGNKQTRGKPDKMQAPASRSVLTQTQTKATAEGGEQRGNATVGRFNPKMSSGSVATSHTSAPGGAVANGTAVAPATIVPGSGVKGGRRGGGAGSSSVIKEAGE